jgi:hypothetical protein
LLPDVETTNEVSRRGADIYAAKLRCQLEPRHNGKYLFLDVDTGEWEMDSEEVIAAKRAATRFPGKLLYGVRIGFPSVARIGHGFSTAVK